MPRAGKLDEKMVAVFKKPTSRSQDVAEAAMPGSNCAGDLLQDLRRGSPGGQKLIEKALAVE
jgi:hypothetical protein